MEGVEEIQEQLEAQMLAASSSPEPCATYIAEGNCDLCDLDATPEIAHAKLCRASFTHFHYLISEWWLSYPEITVYAIARHFWETGFQLRPCLGTWLQVKALHLFFDAMPS